MATLTLEGSTSGNVVVTVPAISGTGNTVTIPAATGTLALASTSTSGGIFFGGATSGVLYQDASNLYWDDTNNRLGIGTTSPQGSLQIGNINSGTSEATYKGNLIVQNAPAALEATGGLEFKTSSSGSGYGWKLGGLNTTNDPFVIGNRANSATWTERMRIDSSGNVGIGTTSPSTYVGSGGLALYGTYGTSTTAFAISNSTAYNASNIARIDFQLGNSFGGLEKCAAIWALNPNAATNNGGALVFGTSANGTATTPTERARIINSGNLLVGTASASGTITSTPIAAFDPTTGTTWATGAALNVNGTYGGGVSFLDGAAGYCLWSMDSGKDFYIRGNSASSALTGGVYLNDYATSWSAASDERLKTIIEPIKDALNKVSSLRTVIGRYNDENEEKRHPFLIAQDVIQVLPEAVTIMNKEDSNQYLGLEYTSVMPLLVASIKELAAKVAALEGAK